MPLGDVSSAFSTAADVERIVASARGVMPPGVVEGREPADTAVYVASIAE